SRNITHAIASYDALLPRASYIGSKCCSATRWTQNVIGAEKEHQAPPTKGRLRNDGSLYVGSELSHWKFAVRVVEGVGRDDEAAARLTPKHRHDRFDFSCVMN